MPPPAGPLCIVCSWYVIYRVLSDQPQRAVVYASDARGSVLIVKPPALSADAASATAASILQWPEPDKLVLMTDRVDLGPDPLVIADSVLPVALPFRTLVIASPEHLSKSDRDLLNCYYQVRLHMPIPSEEEMHAMHTEAFSAVVSADEVTARMQLWGPIPRLVFELPKAEQAAHWQRVASVSVEALARVARGQSASAAAGSAGDSLETLHCIVHERAFGQDAEPESPAADMANAAYCGRGRVVVGSAILLRYVAVRINDESLWSAACLDTAGVDSPERHLERMSTAAH